MIRPTVSITDSGKEQQAALAKKLKGMKSAFVTIGVHEDAGSYEGGGPDVVEVALWNEFGTTKTPERSFIRSAIDDNESLINGWREEIIGKIIHDGWSVDKGLEAIGLRVQILIQNKIKSNVPPPNAPSTLKQKSRDGVADTTLIHTGLLLRSITYKVFT